MPGRQGQAFNTVNQGSMSVSFLWLWWVDGGILISHLSGILKSHLNISGILISHLNISGILIGHLSNKSIVVVSSVGGGLDPAIR